MTISMVSNEHLIGEYRKYLECGGHLPQGNYYSHLEKVNASLVGLILRQDNGEISDVARRIFKYLGNDQITERNFLLASKQFYFLSLKIQQEKIDSFRKILSNPIASTVGDCILPLSNNNNASAPSFYLQGQVTERERLLQQILEEKRALIQFQEQEIQRMNTKLSIKKDKIQQLQGTVADLEGRFSEQEEKSLRLQQEIQRYRNAQVVPNSAPSLAIPAPAQASNQPPRRVRVWNSLKNGAGSVKRFCIRNKRVLEGTALLAGGVCVFIFPEFGIPILLITGAVTAFLDWYLGNPTR